MPYVGMILSRLAKNMFALVFHTNVYHHTIMDLCRPPHSDTTYTVGLK